MASQTPYHLESHSIATWRAKLRQQSADAWNKFIECFSQRRLIGALFYTGIQSSALRTRGGRGGVGLGGLGLTVAYST
jgi:hypothetical protein